MSLSALLKAINLGVAFLLEIAMLAAFGVWGFQSAAGSGMKWVLGMGAPLAAALLWGFVLAPKAGWRLNIVSGVILSSALFGLAALALAQARHPRLALALAVVALINRELVWHWKQW